MEHLALEDQWLDLVEGSLSEVKSRELRAHLDACSDCQRRYQGLLSAHRRSVQAGAAAAAAKAAPVPSHVAHRVLSEARAAAKPAPRRWLPWVFAPVAAGAAAAALVVSSRIDRPAGRVERADDVRFCLTSLAPAQGMRGPGDALSDAAQRLDERWRRGELEPRAAAVRCAGAERRLEALVDARGSVLLLAIREGDRVEVHLYLDDASEAGSARFDGGAQREFVLPPLPEAAARAELSAPTCGAAPAVRP